jgi:hypothetical protein
LFLPTFAKLLQTILSMKSIFAGAMFLLLSLSACNSIPTILSSEADLKLVVVDDKNRPVVGATVGFFATEDDMRKNKNSLTEFDTLKTDRNGVFYTKRQDLGARDLYVSVEYKQMNNWDNKTMHLIGNSSFGDINKVKQIVIQESIRNFIAGRAEKRWKHTAYKVNGRDFPGCGNRLVWGFQRDGLRNFIRRYAPANSSCVVSQSDLTGIWQVDDKNKSQIQIDGSGAGQEIYNFTELNEKRMRYFYQDILPSGQKGVLIEYEFEAE